LRWWSIPRRGWIIILAELAVIVTLASWVYSEYVNNTYFQSYVNGLSPILLPIVSVGFGITSATIATLLYFTMRNVRQREGLREEDSPRRHVPSRRTVKKPVITFSRTEKPTTGGPATGPRARPTVTDVSSSRRGTAQDSGNEEDETARRTHRQST
jgi:hypothetical protein